MKSQVGVLPGAGGIKQAYEEVLKAKQADIVCLSQNYELVIGEYFDKSFAPKLYGRVKTREILPDNTDNREYAKTKDSNLNQVRFTNMKLTETDFIVTADKALLISFQPESAMAIIIEDTEVVKFMGNVFEGMWQRAEK